MVKAKITKKKKSSCGQIHYQSLKIRTSIDFLLLFWLLKYLLTG